MIVSVKHKCVILQVPKCASFSLQSWSQQNLSDADLFTKSLDKKKSKLFIDLRHASICSLSQNDNHILDTGDWRVFAVCRNPYSRLLSAYHHCQEGFSNFLAFDFERFVKEKRFLNPRPHFCPQYTWGCPGLIHMKLENIDEDFKILQKHTGIDAPLSHHNKTRTKDDKLGWESSYDSEMKRIVYDYYQKDFELLGYDE